jgi:hypothetical protein
LLPPSSPDSRSVSGGSRRLCMGLDVHKDATAVAVLNGADLHRQVYEIASTASSLALTRYAWRTQTKRPPLKGGRSSDH